jgi:DNA-binding MarR family transcriptional regulator
MLLSSLFRYMLVDSLTIKIYMSTTDSQITALLQAGQQVGAEAIFFHAAAAKKLHLHVADMKALNLLLEQGPLSAGQLANHLRLTPGAVTSLIRRLMTAGFVMREVPATDHRRVSVRIDPARVAEATKVYQPMIDRLMTLAQTYSPQDLAMLSKYEQKVAEIMHTEALALLKSNNQEHS